MRADEERDQGQIRLHNEKVQGEAKSDGILHEEQR